MTKSKKTNEVVSKKNEVVSKIASQIASQIHEDWRIAREFEPRFKETDQIELKKIFEKEGSLDEIIKKDESKNPKSQRLRLNAENKEYEVNIAALDFKQLPKAFQKENQQSAEHAVGYVLERGVGLSLDALSEEVHNAWKKRNSWAKEKAPQQFLPYDQLPLVEQLKDQEVVITAATKLHKAGLLSDDKIKSLKETYEANLTKSENEKLKKRDDEFQKELPQTITDNELLAKKREEREAKKAFAKSLNEKLKPIARQAEKTKNFYNWVDREAFINKNKDNKTQEYGKEEFAARKASLLAVREAQQEQYKVNLKQKQMSNSKQTTNEYGREEFEQKKGTLLRKREEQKKQLIKAKVLESQAGFLETLNLTNKVQSGHKEAIEKIKNKVQSGQKEVNERRAFAEKMSNVHEDIKKGVKGYKRVQNAFEILGVKENAKQNEIKKKYHDFARKNHPDKSIGNEELMKAGISAYEKISTPENLASYREGIKKRKEEQAPKIQKLRESKAPKAPKEPDDLTKKTQSFQQNTKLGSLSTKIKDAFGMYDRKILETLSDALKNVNQPKPVKLYSKDIPSSTNNKGKGSGSGFFR